MIDFAWMAWLTVAGWSTLIVLKGWITVILKVYVDRTKVIREGQVR